MEICVRVVLRKKIAKNDDKMKTPIVINIGDEY